MESDAVLVVDADAVPTIREPLKPVAGRLCHVADDVCTLELVEKPARAGPQRNRQLLPGRLALASVEEVLGARIRERQNHTAIVYLDIGYA